MLALAQIVLHSQSLLSVDLLRHLKYADLIVVCDGFLKLLVNAIVGAVCEWQRILVEEERRNVHLGSLTSRIASQGWRLHNDEDFLLLFQLLFPLVLLPIELTQPVHGLAAFINRSFGISLYATKLILLLELKE